MNSESREIQDAVQKLAGTFNKKPTVIVTGEVKSVNKDTRTSTVETVLSEATILIEVNLSAEQNDGYILFPAIGSTVIVAMMPDGENYALAFSDIDEVLCYVDNQNSYTFNAQGFVWNTGAFGGMAKTGVLAARLNLLENKVNSILIGINTTFVPVPGDGGAALKAVFLAPPLVTPLTNTTQAQISNDKIKH